MHIHSHKHIHKNTHIYYIVSKLSKLSKLQKINKKSTTKRIKKVKPFEIEKNYGLNIKNKNLSEKNKIENSTTKNISLPATTGVYTSNI